MAGRTVLWVRDALRCALYWLWCTVLLLYLYFRESNDQVAPYTRGASRTPCAIRQHLKQTSTSGDTFCTHNLSSYMHTIQAACIVHMNNPSTLRSARMLRLALALREQHSGSRSPPWRVLIFQILIFCGWDAGRRRKGCCGGFLVCCSAVAVD